MDTPLLSGLKHLTSAAGAPGPGQVGLDVPKGKSGAKADRHAVVVFQINSQSEHGLPPWVVLDDVHMIVHEPVQVKG